MPKVGSLFSFVSDFTTWAIVGLALIWLLLWRIIFKKAGYSNSQLLGLLMVVPLINIFIFCFFAFGEWPILRGTQHERDS